MSAKFKGRVLPMQNPVVGDRSDRMLHIPEAGLVASLRPARAHAPGLGLVHARLRLTVPCVLCLSRTA